MTATLGLVLVACVGSGQTATLPVHVRPPERPRLIDNEREPWLLPGSAHPRSYRLSLRLDPEADHFSGVTEIDLSLEEPSAALVLHGRGITVSRATVTVGARHLALRVSEHSGADPRAAPDVLVLDADEVLSGELTLRLDYQAPYRTDLRGVYRTDQDGKSYLFTQFQPMDARSAFPCFDEPHHKTPFEVTIETPRGNLAVASMPEKSRHEAGDFIRYEFEASPPMPTYLLAFAVGDLQVRSLGPDPTAPAGTGSRALRAGSRATSFGPPIRLITTAGVGSRGDLALQATREHLDFLEGYFGSPYPYPKLDILAVPEFAAAAMENVGLVTFREDLLLVTEDSPSSRRVEMNEVVAHELSHMWFGNLVTMKWWDELWLNEAFATWMATKSVEASHPEFHAREGFLGWLSGAMSQDTMPTARAIRQPVKTQTDTFRAFGWITYAKGAAVLDMTEQWLGSQEFQRGIRRYLKAHAWGSATSQDLFEALSDGEHPVQRVVDSFTTQAGVPYVRVSARCDETGVSLKVDQTPYVSLGSSEAHLRGRRWTLPLCVVLGGEQGRVEECHLLTEATHTFPSQLTECPRWIHPNADLNGYYRSAISTAELERLVRLDSAVLSHREQVGVMRSMSGGVEAGILQVEDFLRLGAVMLASPGRREAAWNQMLWLLYRLETQLVTEQTRTAFERFVTRLVGPALRRVGFEPKPGEAAETKGLRGALFSAAGHLAKDPEVLRRSVELARAFARQPDSVPRDEAQRALPIAAATGDRGVFDGLVRLARSTRVAEDRVLALQALGASTDPELVQKLLLGVLEKDVPPADVRHFLGGLLWEPRSKTLTYPWFREHFATLADSLSLFEMRGYVRAALDRCSLDDRDEIEAAFRPLLEGREAMDEVLPESREGAQRCAAFKAHQQASLNRFLAGQ